MTVTIATRQYQLVPLTHEQVDTNFINLADAVNVNGASISALGQDGGSALIGNGGETVADSFNALQLADYTALRAYVGPRKSVYVIGYLGTAAPSGIAGMLVRDDHDTTTADNGGTVIVTAGGVRYKRANVHGVCPEWFGAKGDGTTDDTAAFIAAFAVAMARATQVFANPTADYKLTSKIAITAGNVQFDGRNCHITNAISNATAADPVFEISGSGVSNVQIGNFRLNGTANNGHVVAILGALSTGPQFVTLDRIWVQSNAGTGKDNSGAAMPAQLLYCYGSMTIKLNKCVSYQSGGVYADSALKLHISDSTIDSPPAGRLVYLKSCNGVLIDSGCVLNGGTTDQVEVDGCRGVKVLGNRLKGGTGRQFYAHGTSSAVAFSHNQQEVYTATANAVEFTTAVASPQADGNVIEFINGTGSPLTFTKSGIALVDEPGGGTISTGVRFDGNSFIVNSLSTIASLISVGSSLNSVQRPHIGSNTLAVLGGGSSSTITKGIDLSANVIGATVENNQYGAITGNTMTTGIAVAASCTGTRLIENYNYGNCTTPVSDAGAKTTRIEGGVFISTSYTPVVSGLSTAGTATYTAQTGAYTRNGGNTAKVDIAVTYTGHTGTGTMTISLPFSGASKFQVLSVLSENLAYSGTLKAAVSPGDNFVRLWAETANGSATVVTVDAAATIYISGVLETA